MRFKKLVSASAALALSATAFAGLGTQALAATTGDLYLEDFSSTTSYAFSDTANFSAEVSENKLLLTSSLNGAYNSSSSKNGATKYKKSLTATNGSALSEQAALKFSVDVIGGVINTSSSGSGARLGFADTNGNNILTMFINSRGTTFGQFTVKLDDDDASSTLNAKTTTGDSVTTSDLTETLTVDLTMNFYAQTETITVTGAESGQIYTNTSTGITATNFDGFYLPQTEWNYGKFYLDNITATSIDGAETTFTVVDSNGNVVEGATITIGSVTLTTDENGQATAALPVSDNTYSYTVTKTGYGSTDTSTGTITVASADDSIEKDVTLDASLTETDVTITCKDENGITLASYDADTVGKGYVDQPFDISSYIEDIDWSVDEDTDYYKAGINYTGTFTADANNTYDSEEGTVTVPSDGNIVLYFDVTEDTYDATIENIPYHAYVALTGTSTSGSTSVDGTYAYSSYSDGSGVATFTGLPEGSYTVTITKNGYTEGKGTLTVTSSSGSSYESETASTIDGYLFYEDFAYVDTTGYTSGMGAVFGSCRYVSSTQRCALDWGSSYTGSSSSVTVPFVSTSDVGTKIVISDLSMQTGKANASVSISFNDAEGNTVAQLLNASAYDSTAGTITSGAVTITDGSETQATFLTVESGSSTVGTITATDFEITFKDGTASGSYNDTSFSFDVDNVEIASITLANTSNNSTNMRLNKIVAEAVPAITAATSDTTVGTISTPTTMKEADTDDEVNYTNIVGNNGVTTVYIKIDNTTPTVAPTLTLSDDTEVKTSKGETWYTEYNGSYYFIYQLVDMADKLSGAEVTCGDDLSTTLTVSE